MRTNIDIDDELMRKVMAATGATTKKAAVEEAFHRVLIFDGQAKALESLWGIAGKEDDWPGKNPRPLETTALPVSSEKPAPTRDDLARAGD